MALSAKKNLVLALALGLSMATAAPTTEAAGGTPTPEISPREIPIAMMFFLLVVVIPPALACLFTIGLITKGAILYVRAKTEKNERLRANEKRNKLAVATAQNLFHELMGEFAPKTPELTEIVIDDAASVENVHNARSGEVKIQVVHKEVHAVED